MVLLSSTYCVVKPGFTLATQAQARSRKKGQVLTLVLVLAGQNAMRLCFYLSRSCFHGEKRAVILALVLASLVKTRLKSCCLSLFDKRSMKICQCSWKTSGLIQLQYALFAETRGDNRRQYNFGNYGSNSEDVIGGNVGIGGNAGWYGSYGRRGRHYFLYRSV